MIEEGVCNGAFVPDDYDYNDVIESGIKTIPVVWHFVQSPTYGIDGVDITNDDDEVIGVEGDLLNPCGNLSELVNLVNIRMTELDDAYSQEQEQVVQTLSD